MHRYWTMWFAVIAAAMTLGACQKPMAPILGASGTTPVTILRSGAGDDAAFANPGVYVINSAEDTKADLSALNVDFTNETVIILAAGQQSTGGYAIAITGIQVAGDALFVQGAMTTPAADAVVTQALTQPYAAAVVAKMAKPASTHPEVQ